MVNKMDLHKHNMPSELEQALLPAGISEILADFKKQGIPAVKREVNIASMIDHTILKPDALPEEIVKLCEEAKEYKFASVCVNPSYVGMCAELLKGTDVKVCTVIGFPLGATTTESKVFETEQAVKSGAEEADMVINIGRLKQGDNGFVFNDVLSVVQAAKKGNAITKVILETCLLTDEEKVKASLICKYAGAAFIKTSTGFSKGGAVAADVALMKYIAGSEMQVKASGGIRTRKDAEDMIAAGADRIGASAGIAIVNG
jgi:deoxyribose-phosphate aldolase